MFGSSDIKCRGDTYYPWFPCHFFLATYEPPCCSIFFPQSYGKKNCFLSSSLIIFPYIKTKIFFPQNPKGEKFLSYPPGTANIRKYASFAIFFFHNHTSPPHQKTNDPSLKGIHVLVLSLDELAWLLGLTKLMFLIRPVSLIMRYAKVVSSLTLAVLIR